MKNNWKLVVLAVFGILFSNLATAQTTKYKTMIQMNNYSGKAAYVVVSLINPKGQYEKTLGILSVISSSLHPLYNFFVCLPNIFSSKNSKVGILFIISLVLFFIFLTKSLHP